MQKVRCNSCMEYFDEETIQVNSENEEFCPSCKITGCLMDVETDKKVMVCSICGSEDVRRNADCEWNVEKQNWETVALFDGCTCSSCGQDCNLKEEYVFDRQASYSKREGYSGRIL